MCEWGEWGEWGGKEGKIHSRFHHGATDFIVYLINQYQYLSLIIATAIFETEKKKEEEEAYGTTILAAFQRLPPSFMHTCSSDLSSASLRTLPRCLAAAAALASLFSLASHLID